MSDVAIAIRGLVRDAIRLSDGDEKAAAERVDALFDQPFRIAIAGMVKAGKSTLLNALVGQRVAPTDSGECTKIVTWYRQGRTYQVTGVDHDGGVRRLRFDRGAEVTVHLEGLSAEDLARIDVEWPSDRLAGRQLIDTPGLGSLSTDVSARTEQFLTDGHELPVDAVVYLMRHRHPADLRFLESFHGDSAAEGAMGSIAVLSRADEVAGGRADAIAVAGRVAESMAADPRIRRLCQAVIPVAGLLAETATTLRQAEFNALRELAALPEEDIVSALLSVDRFMSSEALDLDSATRSDLLTRFGIYGIRLGTRMIAKEGVASPDALADGLAAHSGISELQSSLANRFDRRRDLLRCRTAIGVLQRLSAPMNDPDFTRDLERVLAGAHELVELSVLDRLRLAEPDGMRPDDLTDITRLFGLDGPAHATRLGLTNGSSSSDVRTAATDQLQRWQRRAEHPMSTPEVAHLSRLAVRTCEQVLVPGSLES